MFSSYDFSYGNINCFGSLISFVDSDENNNFNSERVFSSSKNIEVDNQNFEKNLIDKIDNFHSESLKDNESQSAFNNDLITEIRGIRQDLKNNATLMSSENSGNVDVNNDIYNNQIVIIYLLSVLIFVILINRFWGAFRK